MAGFPGETRADHAATLAMMDEIRFDNAFMFYYSERAGTPAAGFDVGSRSRSARSACGRSSRCSSSTPGEEPPLSRTDRAGAGGGAGPQDPGKVAARLDHNKTVLLEGDPAGLRGLYVPVEILATDAFTLEGRAAGPPLPAPVVARADPPFRPGREPSGPLASDHAHPRHRSWRLRSGDGSRAEVLSRELGVQRAPGGSAGETSGLRAGGGPRLPRARAADLHDPSSSPTCRRAVRGSTGPRARDELVTLYGDYDVDGTVAMALLHWVMRRPASAPASRSRTASEDGHGISDRGLAEVRAAGSTLVVTVDQV